MKYFVTYFRAKNFMKFYITTSAYNSILFCCLRRNVEPCCHTHDSRTTVTVYSAKARLVGSHCT